MTRHSTKQARVLMVGSLAERGHGVATLLRNAAEVVALDSADGHTDFSMADHVIMVDPMDQQACTEAVLAFHNAHPIDAVLTWVEHLTPTAAHLAAVLGLPGPGVDAVFKARNKHELRRVMRDVGLPVPVFREVRSLGELEDATRMIGFPCILKPTDFSGSIGVTRLDAAEQVASAYAYVSNRSFNQVLLLEAMVDGPEVSVDTITYNGATTIVAITDRYNDTGPYFAEHGHTVPTLLSGHMQAVAVQTAKAVLEAIGYRNGGAHIEIKLPPGGAAYVLDLGPRLGGGYLVESVELAYGINLYKAILAVACGIAPDLRRVKESACSVRYLSAQPGTITSVTGANEAARQVPGIMQAHIDVKPGHQVRPLTSNAAFLGHVIAIGPDPVEARRRANAYADLVRFGVSRS